MIVARRCGTQHAYRMERLRVQAAKRQVLNFAQVEQSARLRTPRTGIFRHKSRSRQEAAHDCPQEASVPGGKAAIFRDGLTPHRSALTVLLDRSAL
jgi:hypothetical protein